MIRRTLPFIAATLTTLALLPAAAFAAVSVKQAPINGLVGYWDFDEMRGAAAKDRSASNLNFSLTNTTWSRGKQGGAITLGADNAVATTATTGILNTDTHTIAFWFRVNTVTAGWNQVMKFTPAGTDRSPGVWMYPGIACFHWKYDPGNTGTNCAGPGGESTAFTPGRWYHIVGVKNGTAFTFYVNGSSILTPTVVGTKTAGTAAFGLGDAVWGSPRVSIDELRVYNRALSPTEVVAVQNARGAARRTQSNANGTQGYWTLDEGQGTTAHDTSGNNRTGTLVGSPQWTTGKHGRGVLFAGSNYVRTSSLDGYLQGKSAGAISLWFKHGASQPSKELAGWWYNDNFRLSFNASNGNAEFYYSTTGGHGQWITASSAYADNTWHHAVGTYDSTGSAAFYVDNVLINTSAGNGTIVAGDRFCLAAYCNTAGTDVGNYFTGRLDDVMIFDRALTTADVAKLYGAKAATINASRNLKDTNGLTGLWSFDGKDISGTTAYDRASANNGTLTNGPTPAIGKIGQGLNFTSSNSQFVTVGGQSNLGTSNQPYTLSAWAKLANGTTGGSLMHVSSGSDGGGWCLDMLGVVSNKARTYSWIGGPSEVIGNATISVGKWYLITATWSGANGLRLYVNGQLDNFGSQATYAASGGANYVGIGRSVSCANNWGYWNGALDDARIYNKELSAADILKLYRAGQ